MSEWSIRAQWATLFLLNITDTMVTLAGVATGKIYEANPFMAAAIAHSPMVFVVLKITLVSLCLILLWGYRKRAMVQMGMTCMTLAYVGVVLWGVHLLQKAGGY